MNNIIYVFGSNLAGRHGKGSALIARQNYGAVYGQGIGLQGNSYAIPTKDEHIQTMPLDRIQPYIEQFIAFAKDHRNMEFYVVNIGCLNAGYSYKEIAPMFAEASELANVHLTAEFKEVIATLRFANK